MFPFSGFEPMNWNIDVPIRRFEPVLWNIDVPCRRFEPMVWNIGAPFRMFLNLWFARLMFHFVGLELESSIL